MAIYNNDFQCTKTLNITPIFGERKGIKEERQLIGTIPYISYRNEPTLTPIDQYDSDNNYIGTTDYLPVGWTTANVITYLSENHAFTAAYNVTSIQTASDGSTIYLTNNSDYYYQFDKYGTQYPTDYYFVKDNQLFWQSLQYNERDNYSDEWTATTNAWKQYAYGTTITNFDAFNANIEDEILLTQTLFNTDQSYEYISYTYTMPAEPTDEWCNEYTYYYDESGTETECISKTKVYRSLATGFEIKSDNGNTLQSFTFTGGFTIDYYKKDIVASVAQIGGNYYLIFSGSIDDESAMLVYKINRTKSGTNVEQVSTPIKIGAYPSPANRNQTITIQLSGDNKAATELQVVNMNGQVTNRRTIPAGQQQTTLPASRFSTGVNLINILQNGHPTGTTRVIVK